MAIDNRQNLFFPKEERRLKYKTIIKSRGKKLKLVKYYTRFSEIKEKRLHHISLISYCSVRGQGVLNTGRL